MTKQELATELRKAQERLETFQPSGPHHTYTEDGQYQAPTDAGHFAYLLTMIGKIADGIERLP